MTQLAHRRVVGLEHRLQLREHVFGLRRDVAIEFLSDPQLTLPEIANRLGFAEASSFQRAFKAWTGFAPGVYRLRQLAGS